MTHYFRAYRNATSDSNPNLTFFEAELVVRMSNVLRCFSLNVGYRLTRFANLSVKSKGVQLMEIWSSGSFMCLYESSSNYIYLTLTQV